VARDIACEAVVYEASLDNHPDAVRELARGGVVRRDVGVPGAPAAELLLDDDSRDTVGEPPASVLLREHERRQAERGGLVPDLPRGHDVRLVDGGGDRPDLTLGERPAELLDLALLGGQLERLGGDPTHRLIVRSRRADARARGSDPGWLPSRRRGA